MNLWGFPPSVFEHTQKQFNNFLNEHGGDEKAEFFIPTVVDNLIRSGQVKVKVLPTPDSWFGITYREDKTIAAANIGKLIEEGVYPEQLW